MEKLHQKRQNVSLSEHRHYIAVGFLTAVRAGTVVSVVDIAKRNIAAGNSVKMTVRFAGSWLSIKNCIGIYQMQHSPMGIRYGKEASRWSS